MIKQATETKGLADKIFLKAQESRLKTIGVNIQKAAQKGLFEIDIEFADLKDTREADHATQDSIIHYLETLGYEACGSEEYIMGVFIRWIHVKGNLA